MELNRAVAENIKRIRKSKKLSLERTAALSGVSRSMLSQIERGEANPSVAILGKLAEALKVPAEILLENDDFISLLLSREPDNIPKRLDGGKVLLRPSMPYDGVTRQESFFLDLYISAHYRPELAVPGCVCHATVMSGTVSLTAENQEFQLMERDALRFAADRPYEFVNMTNSTARLLLAYQYLKSEARHGGPEQERRPLCRRAGPFGGRCVFVRKGAEKGGGAHAKAVEKVNKQGAR